MPKRAAQPTKQTITNKQSPQKKHYTLLWIIVGVLAGLSITFTMGMVVFVMAWLISNVRLPQSDTVAEISVIKSAYAEMDVAKQEGEAKVAPVSDVQNQAIFAQRSISANFTEGALPYANSVFAWGTDIQNGAISNNWASVAAAPQPYTLKLTEQDAEDSYAATVESIASLQDFGDYALAKGDQATMRWVVARLAADENYLDALASANVTTSQRSTNMAYATSYGGTCYVGRGNVVVYSNRSNRKQCARNLADQIKPIIKAGRAYAYSAKPADKADWYYAWPTLKASGFPTSKTGASNGNDQPQAPPAIQAFRDNCGQKGGTTPASVTKDGLPTTESGMTCKYTGPKGGTCWLYQTDSGANYAGGDGDCDHQGLLPSSSARDNSQPPQTQTQAQQNPYPWDGKYTVTDHLSCSPSGNVALIVSGFGNHFVVDKGQVFYLNHDVAGPMIDAKSGSGSGVATTGGDSYDFSFQFSGTGNDIQVSGTRKITGQVNCNGTFSGQKDSSQ